MKKLESLENIVTETCKKNENNCLNCPMNTACSEYAMATTREEKITALENMVNASHL